MTQTLDVGPLAAPDLRLRGAAEAVAGSAIPAGPVVARSPLVEAKAGSAAAPPSSESATRLLVEAGKGADGFVYKLIDRTTGEILSEFPREAAKSLAQSQSYQAGTVLDESA